MKCPRCGAEMNMVYATDNGGGGSWGNPLIPLDVAYNVYVCDDSCEDVVVEHVWNNAGTVHIKSTDPMNPSVTPKGQ